MKLDPTTARDEVVRAARAWYAGRGNVEAPLAAAVAALERLERQDGMLDALTEMLEES